jgi:hypothetical protein
MRREIRLIGQVRDAEPAHVMLDQGERYDQGDEAMPIVVDHVGEFGARVGLELALEESGDVLQDVRVPASGRADRQRLHEKGAVIGQARAEPRAAGGATSRPSNA